jgi:hypothetical protein
MAQTFRARSRTAVVSCGAAGQVGKIRTTSSPGTRIIEAFIRVVSYHAGTLWYRTLLLKTSKVSDPLKCQIVPDNSKNAITIPCTGAASIPRTTKIRLMSVNDSGMPMKAL